jgi:hypothetical protein
MAFPLSQTPRKLTFDRETEEQTTVINIPAIRAIGAARLHNTTLLASTLSILRTVWLSLTHKAQHRKRVHEVIAMSYPDARSRNQKHSHA